jgi:hypothetical protein
MARTPQPVPQHSHGLHRDTFDNCLVALRDCAAPELIAESSGRFGCTRKKEHAAYGPIQPMDQPKEYVACLPVTTSEPRTPNIKNGVVATARPLTQQSSRLEYRQKVVVFVQDKKVRGRTVHRHG